MADAKRLRAIARRQSVRMAQKATRKALSELPARQRPGTVTRPTLKQTPGYIALSTHPSITFATTKEGRLVLPSEIRGTARHEVAHHLGAGHPALRTTGAMLGGLTRLQVQQAVRVQKEPVERRVQRALRKETRWRMETRGPGGGPSGPEPGFQTPHLKKVAQTGRPAQQRQAREKMRRLGRRLKGRIDF
jgi:hypothetical protein